MFDARDLKVQRRHGRPLRARLTLHSAPIQSTVDVGVTRGGQRFETSPQGASAQSRTGDGYLAGLLLFGLVARRVSRRDRQQAANTSWDQWAAERPFAAVMLKLAPAQLALVAVALLLPSPLGLRVALALLAVGIVVLVAVVVRLAQARSERQSYGRHYGEWSRSTSTGACRSAESGGRDRDQLGGSARALRSAFTTYGGSK